MPDQIILRDGSPVIRLSDETLRAFHSHVLRLLPGREEPLALGCPKCSAAKLVLTWTSEHDDDVWHYYFIARCASCETEVRTDPSHDSRVVSKGRR